MKYMNNQLFTVQIPMKPFWWLLSVLMIVTGTSCRSKTGDRYSDTPTSGKIYAAFDRTIQPVIDAELNVFHAVYQNAHIQPLYLSEEESFKLLFADSVRLVVASRELTKQEISYFNQKKIFPKQVLIASDAIAVIVNPDNPDTLFSTDQIGKIFSGETAFWHSLDKTNKATPVEVVIDNENSGIVRFLIDSIAKTSKTGANLISAKSSPGVIDYVATHAGAIGFIGAGWISDRDDSTCLSFLKQIRVANITSNPDFNSYKPYQAFMATRQYPLCRSIYMITTDPHMGLSDGFVSFVASDKGQRIILKSGLLPAIALIRVVHVNDEN